jgi:hypothetical protein
MLFFLLQLLKITIFLKILGAKTSTLTRPLPCLLRLEQVVSKITKFDFQCQFVKIFKNLTKGVTGFLSLTLDIVD